ncbi:MAG: hypothetical protein A2W33_09450 [Chloroflexi bacterium RBG_16_52_11]|nr:MAG: hypothetical protein A2W33_09450 [Chloroflexi bacterium RBG_16_52_11]
MTTANYDFGYFQTALALLDEYLLSQQIYWTLGARPPAGEPIYPQLTLGGLLLTRAKLRARPLSLDISTAFSQLDAKLETLLHTKRVAWEQKGSKEFRSRLKLWGDYLGEYRKDPTNQGDRYSYEVGRRVMLQLLEPYAVDLHPAEAEMYHGLDGILNAVLLPGSYIWELDTADGFPRETFWYLYGTLRS